MDLSRECLESFAFTTQVKSPLSNYQRGHSTFFIELEGGTIQNRFGWGKHIYTDRKGKTRVGANVSMKGKAKKPCKCHRGRPALGMTFVWNIGSAQKLVKWLERTQHRNVLGGKISYLNTRPDDSQILITSLLEYTTSFLWERAVLVQYFDFSFYCRPLLVMD